jgi:hypothetical protein
LRDDLIAVDHEEAATMMGVEATAALVGHPDTAARRGSEFERLPVLHRNAADHARESETLWRPIRAGWS